MNRTRTILLLVAGLCLAGAAPLQAAGIQVSLTTDKNVYVPGETVAWTLQVATSTGDNAGISSAAFDLTESFGETLQPASALGSEFSAFSLQAGTAFATAPHLRGTGIWNFFVPGMAGTKLLNKGNDGSTYDLVSGSFVVQQPGLHTLEASTQAGGVQYYATANTSVQDSTEFESIQFTAASYTVTPEPTSLILLSGGAVAVLIRRRRR